jgi:hypothetical protein
MYFKQKLVSQLEMIEFLLKNGAQINAKDTNGRSCLHIAAHIGYLNAVSLLINYNADIELVDNGGRTPLLTASWNDNSEVVKRLLEAGAEINHQDQQGATALSIASQKGSYDVVLELLTHGAFIYSSSKNPIQLAIKCGFHDIAQLLENWSVTTGQKPANVPRSSKSLDSFKIHSKATERRIMATLAAPCNKKEKLKNSISYQCKKIETQNTTTTESYCQNIGKRENSFKNFLLKRSSGEKNEKQQLTITLNNKNIPETSIINDEVKLASPTVKVKSSNNKFIQMIRKKFKFLKSNSSEHGTETKRSTMHRSVTDSIAQNAKKNVDDAAFIFNRASINEYFNQRSSFKEYNSDVCSGKIVGQRNSDIIGSNVLKRPTCLPLNYFKKETSI